MKILSSSYLHKSCLNLRRPPGEEQGPSYLWSRQSEGLCGGQRHGGWPLRGPSHVLGDKRGQVSTVIAQHASYTAELMNNEQSCILIYYIVETPVKAALIWLMH